MAKVFNKKNIKILSIIYFIIILIVSIITFIILLGRIINKEEDYLKYKNNIIISSLSNDLKLKINENDNYSESIEIKTDKDILNKKVKGINDYKEFYYFDHEYKLINNNDNDYIISFNLYLLTSNECNISFNIKKAFIKSLLIKKNLKEIVILESAFMK